MYNSLGGLELAVLLRQATTNILISSTSPEGVEEVWRTCFEREWADSRQERK